MSAHSKILALIPARGGSKGVPRKNIRPLCGKPAIAHTIEVANAAADLFHRIVVSTEDAEIASVARQYGAEVPFMRPAELAMDFTPTLPVVQHAIRAVEAQDNIILDWVCLLQPTDPLRIEEDVRGAVAAAETGNCDSVISVVQVFAVHPVKMKRIDVHGRLVSFCMEEREGTRRQDYEPPAYMRNGAIYLTRRCVVMESNSLWGEVIHPYVMPPERSLGVDSELDFRMVELLMAERLEKING
jgi:CMP-N,N'-diacetyllegionaminic acid synthase